MASGFLGEPKLGKEKSSPSSGSSSSRKSKKSNSVKSKQPQRGLGVAQLEKIRLHRQIMESNKYYSYLPSLHNPYDANISQEDMRLQTAYSSTAASLSYSSSPSYGFSGQHGSMVGS